MRVLGPAKLTALLLVFTIAGAAAGYFVAASQARHEGMRILYSFSAMDVRVMTTALTHLRSGRSDKATKFLESMLTGDLITLGLYETHVPKSKRHKEIYESAAKAREYYGLFPQASPSPYAVDGLALGASASDNAP